MPAGGPELAAWVSALLAGAALGFAAGRWAARCRPARERDSAYVRLLQYAAVAANEAATLDEAMDEGVKSICGAMGWPVGRVHRVEREGTLQETRFLLLDGEPDARPSGRILDTTTPTGESLAARAVASGRPACLSDLATRRVSPGGALARRLGLRTAVAIPVLTHGHVAAVLEFAMRERLQPDPRTLEVLALVGVQIGRVAERATVQQRFRQAQKLEAIGRLSAGVAHEINNPMAYVRSNLNQLAAEWKRLRDALESAGPAAEPDTAALAACDELLEETIEGVERTVAIVKDMKEFSHVGSDARVAASLDEIVETALRMASSHAPSTVSVELHSDPDLPRVPCCPNQLVQVLVNLLVNAVEAASPAGRIEVTTCLEEDTAVVQVEDTGPGMDAETRERLFDPFFTTKAAGEGTGLGLTISYEIVRNHGGEIRVISAEGAGTVMEVRLPLEGAGEPR